MVSMFAPGVEYVADKSGICPMCHVFIAKSKSRVMQIPRPLAPRIGRYGDDGGYYCLDTNRPWYYDGRNPGSQKRWVVHHYCYEKALERIDQENETLFSNSGNSSLHKALARYQARNAK